MQLNVFQVFYEKVIVERDVKGEREKERVSQERDEELYNSVGIIKFH